MRHLRSGRKLGRNATHRLALMRNLARALILSPEGRITTTVEKAKEARRFVEKLITMARKGTLHSLRLVLAKLRDKEATRLLVNEIAPRFKDRPGGYTRVLKLHTRRLGDGGQTALLELLREGEKKVRAKAPKAAAPAPSITPSTPAPAAPAPAAPAPAPAQS